MLKDAGEKYFAPATSVQVWLGVKIRLSSVQNGESYWVGSGRRRAVGHGLTLMQQTEDVNGTTTFLPVHIAANTTQNGAISIPANWIFYPLAPPPTAADPFVIPLEEVRSSIVQGLEYQP
jgi:hypothetical protein